MANAAHSFTDTLNANFKEVYADKIQNLIPEGLILLKEVPFAPRDQQPGNLYHQPVVLGHEHGFTYGGSEGNAFNLNAPVAGVIKDAVIRGNEMVLRSALPYAAAARSVGGGQRAFVDATKFLVQNMLESFSKRMEIQLLYGGAGLGKVASVAGNEITVATADWAPGIWAGSEECPIEIRSAAGALRGSATVTKVSLKDRTLELNVMPASVVAGDVLWYKGAFGNEFKGLYTIITEQASLFGIDVSQYNLFKGNETAVTGTLDFAKIEDAVAKSVEKGLAHDVLVLCNVNGWTDLLTEQAGKRVYDDSYKSSEMENGAKSIKFYGQNGVIEVRPSIYVKEGHCFVISMEEMVRIGSTDITFRRPGRGDEFFRELDNSAGYELRAYTDQALFCYRPGVNTIITGINN